MEQLRVNGLVVRENPMGDNDKLLTVITEEMGKIMISGKGVRSLRSKHMPATQLFSYSSFVLRKSHGYFYISDSTLNEAFFGIRMDLDKLALASYLCDVAAEFSVEGIGDEDLMRLTLNTLFALSNDAKIPLKQIKAAFEFRCASIEGFKPNLVACDQCAVFEGKTLYLDHDFYNQQRSPEPEKPSIADKLKDAKERAALLNGQNIVKDAKERGGTHEI